MSMYALGILPLIHKLKAKKLVWLLTMLQQVIH